MTDPATPTVVDKLVDLLDLEQLEVNLFRGPKTDEPWRRVYGGQVIGQALVAAARTVEGERPAHSLHAYFIRPGDPAIPIVYEVSRDRDGQSFTTRRVVAIQHGRPIFNMAASFQVDEGGVSHQFDMPDVPGPEGLMSELELRQRDGHKIPEKFRSHWLRERPIEIRPIAPRDMFNPGKGPPAHDAWFRVAGPIGDDRALHQCMLAYASDMTLLDTCLLPHDISWLNPKLQSASLDHAIWFHEPFRADEWLLYVQDSPKAAGARGFNRGSIYTRDGRLVASVAQEGLIRIRD
ncbi:acyl-CoA thioesterase II [Sphingoaurantiacus capsulatus]|uniref:Acyl-CoA thioesterase II n=1 Tax=Sphingoaurantiacus capsulatus TaxID=1771310 RepID=A0ABV7XE39_9SPHN